MTLISRITGLIRDILIARFFGVSGDTDAYYVAFRLPNLLRRLFAEGAFQQAFVPMLADAKSTKAQEEAKTFIDKVASLLATVVLLVSILGSVCAPILVWIIASGLYEEPETFKTATQLTRIMFPYIFFMSMVALSSSILNTWKEFAIPAAVPILLNLSLICAPLFVAPHMERPIFALAFGALKDPAVRKVLKLMVPALFAVGVAHISILINTNIASFLAEGSVTWLTYADRLMEFPTALLGVALGTVLLPSLSAAFAKGAMEKYNALLNWGLKLIVAFAVPAALGLAFLSEALVSVLFQSKLFGPNDVLQTSTAVLGYSAGLIGLIGIKILAPGFYAQKDIKTPVKVACAALIVTQLFNLINVPLFAHVALALSVGLRACFNSFILLSILRKRKIFTPVDGWRKLFASVFVSSVILSAILFAAQVQIDWTHLEMSWAMKMTILCGLIAVAGFAYLFSLFVFGYRLSDLRVRGVE